MINFDLMSGSKNMDELRQNFLEVTREIYTSQKSKEEKEKLRIESENLFDNIKKNLLK